MFEEKTYEWHLVKINIDDMLRDNHKIPDIYRMFLTQKAEFVSPRNEEFIQEVYERSMRRMLQQKGMV